MIINSSVLKTQFSKIELIKINELDLIRPMNEKMGVRGVLFARFESRCRDRFREKEEQNVALIRAC